MNEVILATGLVPAPQTADGDAGFPQAVLAEGQYEVTRTADRTAQGTGTRSLPCSPCCPLMISRLADQAGTGA